MRRFRDERGDATVEAVLAVPVLLLLITIVIQFGLYYHAAHTAEAAAQEGARAARVEGAVAADGQQRAEAFMADAAPTLVDNVTVIATRGTETAHVEVRGTVHSIVPGLTLRVQADAASPVERFRADVP
ncbi:MAG: TadE/TadG family type IV pilus assembly protein [Acidimicrobiia bacterium]